jgi:hypothetical protein
MTDKFKYLLILWIFFIIPIHTDGQETKSRSTSSVPWTAGSAVHTGFLINHHNNMRIFNEQIPYLFELYIAKTTTGEKTWHSFYRNPQYGISYIMFDLGSPSYLGKAHGIYPFLHFFPIGTDRKVSLNMRLGAGVAYMEKIFDRMDNYKNIAISTRFNAVLNFRMEGRVRIATPLSLSGGWAFTHISNGTVKKPNSGLNYLTVYAGANYAFGKERLVETADINFDTDKKWHYTVYLSGGVKTYTIFDDIMYAVSGLSFEASRSHLAFTRFSGVLDLFYDSSDYVYLIEDEIKTSKIQTIKPGLAAGYSFLFGKLAAGVQIGRYLYAKNRQYGLFYQRLALNYSMSNRLNVRFGLKTHWGQADYLELSVGYKIK